MPRRVCIVMLLLAGCGPSTATAPTPAPTRPPLPAPAPTLPPGTPLQVLVNDSQSGNSKGLSNNYIFTPPHAAWVLHWRFTCPPQTGLGPNRFVVFSSSQTPPIVDPGSVEMAGSGVTRVGSPAGKQVVMSVLAFTNCRYHVEVDG